MVLRGRERSYRSFQTTYEELKPRSIASPFLSCSWGFQTTYEELKRPSKAIVINSKRASRLPMRNWNSLDAFWASVFGLLAFRLPMRNWNLRQSLGRLLMLKLSDYLWGIETAYSREVGNWRGRLPDYLWGIETWTRSENGKRLSSFQTTYEELKHFQLLIDISNEKGFQTTYEELKTVSLCQRLSNFQAFRLPMRNWNSSSSRT